jgi:hypothetical protein
MRLLVLIFAIVADANATFAHSHCMAQRIIPTKGKLSSNPTLVYLHRQESVLVRIESNGRQLGFVARISGIDQVRISGTHNGTSHGTRGC